MTSRGHKLLMTRCGPLDMLGFAGNQHDYQELAQQSVAVSIDEDVQVLVVDLPMLIRIKEELPFEKDRAVLPLLRATHRIRLSLQGSSDE